MLCPVAACAARKGAGAVQVLALQLDRGHNHTCMAMALLRTSCAEGPKGRRPFLLLASNVMLPDTGLQQMQGLLSIFELRINPHSRRCLLHCARCDCCRSQACAPLALQPVRMLQA